MSTIAGTKRTYLRKEFRREDVIRRARHVFARKGFRETSIDDILKACNIAQGTLYLHFTGKKDIFREILIDGFSRIQEIIRPIRSDELDSSSSKGFELYEYIRRKNRSFFEAVEKERELFRIMLFESYGLDEDINKIIKNIFAMVQSQVETELVMFRTMGVMNDVDIPLAVQAILGSVIMAIMNNFFGNSHPDIDYISEQVTRLQLFGYGKRK